MITNLLKIVINQKLLCFKSILIHSCSKTFIKSYCKFIYKLSFLLFLQSIGVSSILRTWCSISRIVSVTRKNSSTFSDTLKRVIRSMKNFTHALWFCASSQSLGAGVHSVPRNDICQRPPESPASPRHRAVSELQRERAILESFSSSLARYGSRV